MSKKAVQSKKPKKQRLKAQRKFSKAAKKGKLRRHVKERIKDVESKKSTKQQQRQAQIRKDWLLNRQARKREDLDESDEESSKEDLLDYAATNSKSRRNKHDVNDDDDDEEMSPQEWAAQLRTFVDERELLPVKLGGKLVRRLKQVDPGHSEEDEEEEMDIKQEVEDGEEGTEEDRVYTGEVKEELDLGSLSDEQLAEHHAKLFAKAEADVAMAVDAIILDPRENVSKFRPLLHMAAGQELSSLIRERVQKLVTASLAELFVNVLPGYPVHALTETEKSQKMRKETKRLAAFEESLLNYYIKYLKFLEKNATKLIPRRRPDESTFSAQFAFLCTKCLCRLGEECTHFNYAPNIISCLVRLCMSKWEKLLDECCACITRIFASDRQLSISLHGVKAISTLVDKRKGSGVPAKLISTLLSLNIREVERKEDMTAATAKNKQKKGGGLRKREGGRNARKYDKQIGKLEVELQEAIASDAHATKLRLGTEVIKHVFITYFRVLRRMPQSPLLRPVLKGIAKFIHLINVEFYDDLVLNMEKLIDMKKANKLRVAMPLNYSIDHLQRLVEEVSILYEDEKPSSTIPKSTLAKKEEEKSERLNKFKFLVPI